MQFAIDGTDSGSPVPLADGVATSAAITSIPHGHHQITGSFISGPAFARSSGSLTQTVYGTVDVPCQVPALVRDLHGAVSQDTLSLAAGCTYRLTATDNSTDGPTGLPVIGIPLTIEGNGATITRSTSSGTPNFRLLDVTKSGDLSIDDLTLSNGVSDTLGGGGIINDGIVALIGSTLSANSSPLAGGGVVNYGTLAVTNSTLSGNTTGGGGGGIDNGPAGTLTITNSTVADNSGTGGGIATTGPARVTNSIIADNSGGNCNGAVTDGGYDLENGTSCNFSDHVVDAEPGLGSLATNGGPTETMAITQVSPAFGMASPAVSRRAATGWSRRHRPAGDVAPGRVCR